MAWSESEVQRFIDPRFGLDPYFKRVAGQAECSEQHLSYMLRIVWPLFHSCRMVIVAQKAMTTYMVIGLFSVGDRTLDFLGAGHILYEDFPGKGKTLLANVPAIVLGGRCGRFQGDPEKTPTDYTGNRILTEEQKFELVPGPAFNDIVLADEVNRFSPDTMSVLLEQMSEGYITIFGTRYPAPAFFLFTMNPIETEGTRKLLEALTDRIMFKVTGEWFVAHDYAEILERTNDYRDIRVRLLPVCSVETCKEVREFFHGHIYVSSVLRDKVFGRFAEITNDPRRFGFLQELENAFFGNDKGGKKERESGGRIVISGLSGRGVGHWEGAAKTLAAFRYRNYVLPEDALKVLLPVLRHRMRFAPGVLEFFTDLWGLFDKSAAVDRIILQLVREAW